MKYEWKAVEGANHPSITTHVVAGGEVYFLEIVEESTGAVTGTAWKEVPATFWEPGDVACVHEEAYEFLDAAKYALAKFDADAATHEREWEDKMSEHQNQLVGE